MATRSPQTIATILHLTADTFFALLPLLVMGLVWPSPNQHHPTSFWLGPEISMTSCVLYGLGLSKLLQGSVVVLVKQVRDQIQQIAAVHVVLSLIPTVGIILSVIAINRTLTEGVGFGWHAFQYVNLLMAIVVFFVVGGYGVKRAEAEG